jgi:hypothetical protein
VYLVLRFGLASGLRPVADGGFGAPLAFGDSGRIRVAEKNSPKYVEVRTLRRSPRLRAIQARLAVVVAAAERRLASFDGERYEALGAPPAVLLDDRGVPRVLTPTGVAEILAQFPDVRKAFPFAPNVGRHLLATAGAERGVDPGAMEQQLGHGRLWREADNRFAMADLVQQEADFAALASTVERAFGLPPLDGAGEEGA